MTCASSKAMRYWSEMGPTTPTASRQKAWRLLSCSSSLLIEHLKFVYDHHRNIDRVAAITDNAFLKIAPNIAQHFAHPEIKVFASGERAQALVVANGA